MDRHEGLMAAYPSRIVREIGRLIERDVNLMDENGVILASTDVNRVGQLHEGAARLVREGLSSLAVREEDGYTGAKPGLNLPIVIDGVTLGVVGITGPPEEVAIFGRIIKRTAELMIGEEQKRREARLWDNAKDNFLRELLLDDTLDEETYALRARLLGIAPTVARRCLVMEPLSLLPPGTDAESRNQALREALFTRVRAALSSRPESVIFNVGHRCVALYPEEALGPCKQTLIRLKTALEASAPVQLAAGIGSLGDTAAGLRRAYREAENACRASANTEGCPVKAYDEIDLALLLGSIPPEAKRHFLSNLFRTCPPEEQSRFYAMLLALYRHNGSITHAAGELFIHKNTLQSWILKLKKCTGYDPRTVEGAIPLYLALLLHQERR